jgi:hypothetical protein
MTPQTSNPHTGANPLGRSARRRNIVSNAANTLRICGCL